jgi:hypothetical protein
MNDLLLATWFLRVRDRSAERQGLVVEGDAVGVDGRTDGGPAGVVPYGGPIRAGGSCVDVVAQEFRGQVVLAAATGVTAGTPVDLA